MAGPRIHVLPDTLANQIAAGEVVERPAAVVKELVENALDAGARQVDVDLLEGGGRLVRVRDDGSGMGREDALLCLQRHATSKLRTKDDLFAIATYGFRGEAVPSIAAVSRFTLLTCEPGALAGTRIRVEGGEIASVEEAGAPPGTTVEVRDLFWNVPARRKFLKRPPTEQSYAAEAVLKLSLPRLDVGFTLREGERSILRSPAGATLADRAVLALGREVRDALLPFDSQVRGVRAWGLAASPDVSAGNGRGIWIFVNGRAVRDRQLAHAVLQAYGEVLPHGRYPSALVFVEVPPAEVDVNVHPAKTEVRLSDARAAYESIRSAIAAVLVHGEWLHLPGGGDRQAAGAPGAGASDTESSQALRVADAIARYGRRAGASWPAPGPRWAFPERPGSASGARGGAPDPGGDGGSDPGGDGGSAPAGSAGSPPGAGARADPGPTSAVGPGGPWTGAAMDPSAPGTQVPLVTPAPFFRGLRYLGQLHRTYLICEGPRGLVLIDQHAAHERMNYQRLRRAARERAQPGQPLLLPLVVELPLVAAALIGESAEALAALGIEVAPFGGASVAVQALPAALARLSRAQVATLLGDLADELGAQGRSPSLERVQDALLARAACHASVRAHDALAPAEAQALLDALDETDYGARCAHGRPVVAEWTTAEVERRFGRDYETYAHAAAPEIL